MRKKVDLRGCFRETAITLWLESATGRLIGLRFRVMATLNAITKNHVTVAGNTNSGRTMLFAHGFGTDQTAWADVAKTFLPGYRVIRYDNVGAGKSDPEAFSPNRYDNLHAYADDLVAICEALAVRDAVLVGHSVSGIISVLAAIKEPRFFSRLVLLGASPRYRNDTHYHGGFEQADLDALYGTMQTNYHAWVSGFAPIAMANPERPQLANYFADSLRSIRPDIALAVMRAIMQSDHRADLARLDKPTLLIQSRMDMAVPLEVAQYLQRQIRGSQLAVVNASGHFPHISAPEVVIEAIQAFLRS